MTKIIGFVNQKGGVGKTTSAVNMAAGFAVTENRTLLVDLDPQTNATSGVENILKGRKNNSDYSTYDMLINDVSVKDIITKTKLSFLDVIPSSHDLVGAEIELVGLMAREYKLKNALDGVVGHYEFVLIDCPPSLGLLTLNALAFSDSVLIPIQCEYYALEGLSQLLQTIRLVQRNLNKKLDIEGVLITMYDRRLNLSKQVEEEVRSYFIDKTFKTIIHRNVRLGEAPGFGKPILLYEANSRGARDYLSLVEEILTRGK